MMVRKRDDIRPEDFSQKQVEADTKSSTWCEKYKTKHRWIRIEKFPDGIDPPQKVRIYRQNDYFRLQFWDPAAKKNLTERVDGDLVTAIFCAREIEERLKHFRSSGLGRGKLKHQSLLDLYQSHLQRRADAGEIAPKTVRRYASALEHYRFFIQQPLISTAYPSITNVNRDLVLHFQTYLKNLQVSSNGHPNTQKQTMSSPDYVLDVVRGMYIWAADPDRGNLMPSGFRNPFQGKVRQSASVAPDLFGEPDIIIPMVVDFLKKCDSYQLHLFVLLIFYGLRASEPCFLFRENLTSDGWLKVICLPQISYTTKGRRDKRLPLLEPIRAILEGGSENTETGLLIRRRAVFEGSEQPPLFDQSLEQLTKEYSRRCQKTANLTAEQGMQIRDQLLHDAGGIKYDHIENEFHRLAGQLFWPAKATLKDFRHLFSTAMMNAGMPEYYRKYLMGHAVSKAAITNYTHLDQLRERYLEASQRQFQPIIAAVIKRKAELKSATEASVRSTFPEMDHGPESTHLRAG